MNGQLAEELATDKATKALLVPADPARAPQPRKTSARARARARTPHPLTHAPTALAAPPAPGPANNRPP
eukprot:446389-Prymnesium_polylepis.1